MTEFQRALDLARTIHHEDSFSLISPIFQLLASRANNKALFRKAEENENLITECRELVKKELVTDIPADKKERRELLLEELTEYIFWVAFKKRMSFA